MLCGHVKLFTCLSHWGNCVVTTSDTLHLLRLKMRLLLISFSRFYDFIDINTQNINFMLKLYQSSWYVIKYSIFNNICFRHQLILRGNDKMAASSSPCSIDYMIKINRYRADQWGENNLFKVSYEDALAPTLKTDWFLGPRSPSLFQTKAASLYTQKEDMQFLYFSISYNLEDVK